jgi:hypothetical protein
MRARPFVERARSELEIETSLIARMLSRRWRGATLTDWESFVSIVVRKITEKGPNVRLAKITGRFVVALCLASGPIAACGDDSSSDSSGGSSGTSAGTSGKAGSAGKASTGGTSGTGGSAGSVGGSSAGGSSGSTGSGGAGGSIGGGGQGGTGGCLPLDLTCEAPGSSCCAGTECVEATPKPICLIPCDADGDCTTGCCLQFGNVRRKVCGTASECGNCAAIGQPCPDGSCCAGAICTTIDSAMACAKQCTAPSDCPSNCCVLLGNDTRSVCLDARFCPDAGP